MLIDEMLVVIGFEEPSAGRAVQDDMREERRAGDEIGDRRRTQLNAVLLIPKEASDPAASSVQCKLDRSFLDCGRVEALYR